MHEVRAILRRAHVVNAEQEAAWITDGARDVGEALAWARRRAAGEPLQYILGTVAFRHLSLEVGPGAFIPRPETELVAGRAIELLPPNGTAVDLCTGSGAIALAIADERPDAEVHATELSTEALIWARKNRGRSRVDLYEGDLFDPLPSHLRGKVDVVVANPPYVAFEEVDSLPSDVVDHEPHVALIAPGSGLSVVGRIVAEAPRWLGPGGWLVLEIGEGQGASVRAGLVSGGFDEVSVDPDLADRDRIACGRRS